jgi:hypothetical protein
MPFEDPSVTILISPCLGFTQGFFTPKRRSQLLRTGLGRNWRNGNRKLGTGSSRAKYGKIQ